MLKILESKDEAIELVEHLAQQDFLEDFLVGATGAFMENNIKKSSSLDIVLKLKEGRDKNLIGSISIVRGIKNYFETYYYHKFNVLWLDLLTEDEESLIEYISTEGMEANPESVYINVVDGLKWDGESISDEESDDEIDEDYDSEEEDEE